MSTRKIKDGKVDGEKVYFSGHAQATYMSDGRTVESAISELQSGGVSAYPQINHGTSDTTFILTPNTLHVWDEVAALDLTLGEAKEGIVNEYVFQFTSGATPTILTLPDTIQLVNGEPNIEANKTYQVSVVNNIGLIVSV